MRAALPLAVLLVGCSEASSRKADDGSVLAQSASALELGWWQREKLTAADADANDTLGGAVAASGDTVIAGAVRDEPSNAGSAYVFVRNGPGWVEQQKLLASDRVGGSTFGASVAVAGDTAVVGSYGDASSKGAAYVFVRSGGIWTEQQKLTASDGAASSRFGWSVTVEGDTVLVGSPGHQTASGAAYVFTRNGSVWSEQQKLVRSDTEWSEDFGESVALSGDTALVGCELDNQQADYSGSAYVFVRNGSTWTEQQKLLPSDGVIYDHFGSSAALSGDRAFVGAHARGGNIGAVYFYERSGSTWTEEQTILAGDGAIGDVFADSIALSGDRLLVGAWGDDDHGNYSGSAYVFHYGSTWTLEQKITPSDGQDSDEFGISVGLSGDVAAIGAHFDDDKADFAGATYVFERGLGGAGGSAGSSSGGAGVAGAAGNGAGNGGAAGAGVAGAGDGGLGGSGAGAGSGGTAGSSSATGGNANGGAGGATGGTSGTSTGGTGGTSTGGNASGGHATGGSAAGSGVGGTSGGGTATGGDAAGGASDGGEGNDESGGTNATAGNGAAGRANGGASSGGAGAAGTPNQTAGSTSQGAPTDTHGGCGCHTSPSRSAPGWWLTVALALVSLRARARRSIRADASTRLRSLPS